MSHGETFAANRSELPAIAPGARLWRFAPWNDGHQYIPYFYNPALDASGNKIIFTGNRNGQSQLYLLDLVQDTVTQLTNAQGSGQNWAPYIRENVNGIRPQFIAWTQPDYQHAAFFENNTLCIVNVESLEVERLHELPNQVAPSVLHCSPQGWVAFGYLPRDRQEQMRLGATVFEIDEELREGCGFVVYDLVSRQLVLDVPTPFWPNHVAASPDHAQVLCCHEGLWELQRMFLYDVATGDIRPLREQDGEVRIGHEFWIDPQTVGYHGSVGDHGFFGTIDIATGDRIERPSPSGPEHFYGHYHVSPDGRFVLTDGEVTPDKISISPLTDTALEFVPVCSHDWPRSGDQRVHPHPNWHQSGRFITFTGYETLPSGEGCSRVCLLELPPDNS